MLGAISKTTINCFDPGLHVEFFVNSSQHVYMQGTAARNNADNKMHSLCRDDAASMPFKTEQAVGWQ